MCQQTKNAFYYTYQFSKLFWATDDDHFDKVLSSPPPPVSHKRNKKTSVRPCTQQEIEDNEELMLKYGIKI